MSLSATLLLQLREQIGYDPDVGDDDPADAEQFSTLETLWNLYTSGTTEERINRVALHVWRVRLGNHQARAFDVAQEGNWLARSQRARFLQSKVSQFERKTGQGARARNDKIQSQAEAQDDITTE